MVWLVCHAQTNNHNKRFIFIRIMVQVNLVAGQTRTISHIGVKVDKMCWRYDDDGPAVRHEKEDSTSSKSTATAGSSGGFAGPTRDQKAGNILMEQGTSSNQFYSRKKRRRRRKRKGVKTQNIRHKDQDQDPFTKVHCKICLF